MNISCSTFPLSLLVFCQVAPFWCFRPAYLSADFCQLGCLQKKTKHVQYRWFPISVGPKNNIQLCKCSFWYSLCCMRQSIKIFSHWAKFWWLSSHPKWVMVGTKLLIHYTVLSSLAQCKKLCCWEHMCFSSLCTLIGKTLPNFGLFFHLWPKLLIPTWHGLHKSQQCGNQRGVKCVKNDISCKISYQLFNCDIDNLTIQHTNNIHHYLFFCSTDACRVCM